LSLEFSKDNFSQLVALTTDGVARSFLLKGRVPDLPDEPEMDPMGYFEPEKLDIEKRPQELVPFYEVAHSHFNSADAPVNDQ
jgi:hypothetical protein